MGIFNSPSALAKTAIWQAFWRVGAVSVA